MRHKFDSIVSGPKDSRRGNEIDKDTGKGKGQDSRGAFKVGVTYNSILDERDDEENESGYDDEVSFFTAKDTGTDASSASFNYTQPSSFLRDNDDVDSGGSKKRRRVVKKKCTQEKCLNVDLLPDSFQTVFSFQQFNRMQSESFPFIYGSNDNCVVSSPTGSGKTVLFELAIMRLIKDMGATENVKALYIAPTKSLCCEKFKSWSPKFLGLSVGMLTSDTSFLEAEKVKRCNIIITTPEKWDLLTRKWKDYSRLFELVKLILVDEVHIIRERRGATLEVVLTRMNLFCERIRIVAASATIPNVEDVAQWLRSASNGKFAKILAFDDTYRQVTLERHVYGYSFNTKNEFQHDSLYNFKLDEILFKHSEGRAVLIFCPTRASTVSTAKYVAQHCSNSPENRHGRPNRRVDDQSLASLVEQGVAFHHAGLSMTDREIVEQSFLRGDVRILCSTSTLAVGVNLPAYLVIIKGTRMWNASECQEYTCMDILQMIGRAGRPQFEKNGCAVILTESKMKESYEKLILGTDELESALHLELIEHLAAEVSLSTIFSLQSAVNWLQNTYFYVRFKKNPSAYCEVNRIVKDSLNQDSQILRFVQNLLNKLLEVEIIERRAEKHVSTPYGNAMVRHYVLFDSMKAFLSVEDGQSPEKILSLLAGSKEFTDIRIRQKEKRLYREINNSPLLRFPYLTEKKQTRSIETPEQKVSLLIQYELGGLEYPTYNGAFALHQTMVQDRLIIFRHCFRLLKCMVDIFVEKEDGTSLKNALFLLRSVSGNCWEDSVMVLRQLKSIGLISVRKLVQKGIQSLQDMRELSHQQIESYLSLKIGNGSKIKRDVNSLPRLGMECTLEYFKRHVSEITVTFKIQISAEFTTSAWHGQNLSIDVEVLKVSGKLLDFRRISLVHLASPRTFTVTTVIYSTSDDVEFSMNCLEVAGLGEKTKFYASDLLSNCSESSLAGGPAKQDKRRTPGPSGDATESSPSSDDSIFEYLSTQPEGVNHQETAHETETSKQRKVRSNGNFECYHSCKDKTKCRHLCCKEGIPGYCLRRKSTMADHESTSTATADKNDAYSLSVLSAPHPERITRVDSNYCPIPLEPPDRDAPTEELSRSSYRVNEPPPVNVRYNKEQRQPSVPSSSVSSSQTEGYGIVEDSDLEFLGSDVELS